MIHVQPVAKGAGLSQKAGDARDPKEERSGYDKLSGQIADMVTVQLSMS